MPSGQVFNVQRFSTHDGPGIRTTVFLKGCPARCVWCHNPESQAAAPVVMVQGARCIQCGECVEACPEGAPVQEGGRSSRAGVVCRVCSACVEVCPTGARTLAGASTTVAEVVQQIVADRVFFEQSGGGATFSGGEPLVQFEFLAGLLAACRAQGVHTAVDTCGFAPREHLLAIAPLTDVFLYDLKAIDPGRHRALTGIPNAPILDNLRALGEVHANIWLRVPIIPGVNDDADNLDATARVAQQTRGVRQVNLLPYHRTAQHKFAVLGRPFPLPDTASPSDEELEAHAQRFRARGLATRSGG